MASVWMQFKSPEVPFMSPQGQINTASETFVGEVRLPAKCPWWMHDEFEKWKSLTKAQRDLDWSDFPVEEYLAILFSKNRAIRLYKPTSPRERRAFVLIPGDLPEKVEKEIKKCQEAEIHPMSAINGGWLRKHGLLTLQDLTPDTDQRELEDKGYVKGYLSDILPWMKDETYETFEPRVDPEGPHNYLDVMPVRFVSHTPWPVGERWTELMEQIWGPQVETTGVIPTKV